jgi:hypothetical protein
MLTVSLTHVLIGCVQGRQSGNREMLSLERLWVGGHSLFPRMLTLLSEGCRRVLHLLEGILLQTLLQPLLSEKPVTLNLLRQS